MSTVNDSSVYCLHIEVLDSNPAIWRRFCVEPQLTLAELHQVLTGVMGWSGTANYRFKAPQPGQESSMLDISSADDSVNRLSLQDLVSRPEDSFSYTYSLAQGWIHTVTLENIQPVDADRKFPYCLEGEQACPPEFCVGIWDYEELIDRLSDPDDPDYDHLWEKIGYDFDPQWFDLKAVNQRLKTPE
jgi:hypothetical protein